MRNMTPIILKELREMSRDTTLPVLVVILIATTLVITISGSDVTGIPTVIIRNDYSEYSNALVDSIKGDNFFWVQHETSDKTYSYQLLKTQKAVLVIDIPPDLGSDISAGKGEVTLIYEADNRKEAGSALLHLQKILSDLNQQMLGVRLLDTGQILSRGVEEVDKIPPSFDEVENSLTAVQEGILKLQSELSSGGEIKGFEEELGAVGSKLSQTHYLLMDVGDKMNNVYTQLNDPQLIAAVPLLPPDAQQSYNWAVKNVTEAAVETATADKSISDASRKIMSMTLSVTGSEIDFAGLAKLKNDLSYTRDQLNLLSERISNLRDILVKTNENLQNIGNVKLSVEERNSELELKEIVFAISAPIMLWLLSMLVSLRSLANERAYGTLKRLVTAPISLWELIAGKFIALSIVISIVPSISMILVTIYVLGLKSIGNILFLSLIYILISINGISLGIFISSMTKSERRALELLGFVVASSLPLLGWITLPEAMSPLARLIEHLTPISYFTKISRSIMLRGDTDIWGYLLVPFIFTIIYFILSELFLEREIKSA